MNIKLLFGLFSHDAQKRYEAKHDFITAIAERWGLRTYNRNLAWFQDAEYKKIWKDYPETTDYIHERKFTLFNIAKSVQNINGDIAECGVFKAGSSYLMLMANQNTDKHFYGFDSFEGLSDPKDADIVHGEKTFKWKKHDMSVEEEVATKNLAAFKDRVSLHKGWIPDRFSDVDSKKFSLVHIDVDLYDPTMDSLEFFFPRMSKGGAIICDDYGFESCPGARKAMDEFAKKQNVTVIHLTTGQGLIRIN
jgi:hypothetical protein